MRAIVVGTGTIGSAVRRTLEEQNHEVVSVSRKAGDCQADMADAYSMKTLFSKMDHFDAVACAAGDVFLAPLEMTTDEQWANSILIHGVAVLETNSTG